MWTSGIWRERNRRSFGAAAPRSTSSVPGCTRPASCPWERRRDLSSAETTHYRLLTEGLARRLTRELSRGRTSSLGVYGHPALTAAETDSLDELWWGEDRYYQFVLARLGRQVLFLRYEGETDLWQAEAYFASLLKK